MAEGFRFSADRGALYENLVAVPKTLKREMRSLIKASRELNCEELLLLNPREARTETITWQNAERQIRLVPIWQWLLEN